MRTRILVLSLAAALGVPLVAPHGAGAQEPATVREVVAREIVGVSAPDEMLDPSAAEDPGIADIVSVLAEENGVSIEAAYLRYSLEAITNGFHSTLGERIGDAALTYVAVDPFSGPGDGFNIHVGVSADVATASELVHAAFADAGVSGIGIDVRHTDYARDELVGEYGSLKRELALQGLTYRENAGYIDMQAGTYFFSTLDQAKTEEALQAAASADASLASAVDRVVLKAVDASYFDEYHPTSSWYWGGHAYLAGSVNNPGFSTYGFSWQINGTEAITTAGHASTTNPRFTNGTNYLCNYSNFMQGIWICSGSLNVHTRYQPQNQPYLDVATYYRWQRDFHAKPRVRTNGNGFATMMSGWSSISSYGFGTTGATVFSFGMGRNYQSSLFVSNWSDSPWYGGTWTKMDDNYAGRRDEGDSGGPWWQAGGHAVAFQSGATSNWLLNQSSAYGSRVTLANLHLPGFPMTVSNEI